VFVCVCVSSLLRTYMASMFPLPARLRERLAGCVDRISVQRCRISRPECCFNEEVRPTESVPWGVIVVCFRKKRQQLERL